MEKRCGKFDSNAEKLDSSRFFCAFEKAENGKVILTEQDAVYRKISHCNTGTQTEYEQACICTWFDKYKGTNGCFTCLRSFKTENGQVSHWRVTFQFTQNRLECIGWYLSEERYEQICKDFLLQKSAAPVLEAYDLSFLLFPENGCHYRIETACETGSAYLEVAHKHFYIDSFFRKERENYTLKYLSDCIKKQAPMAFYDIYTVGLYEVFIHITLLPVIHTEKTYILLLAKVVDETVCAFANAGYLQIADSLFKTPSFGVCILNCEDRQKIVVEHSNDCFTELFLKNRFSLKDLYATTFFEKSLKGITGGGTFAANIMADPAAVHYVNTVPAFTDGKVSRVLVMLLPNGSVSLRCRSLLEKLTPREMQIMCLIIAGYTNRYIAHTLSISEGTVKKIAYNIYQKLNVVSRIELLKRVLNI
ncbi:MAG: LuxR C-terminal-related transcriptional regulator [Oscillospiraceae bacterium]|nr:LuxR C-terminal-related transcriptional regulator [Oscillospiraceae bacterium]